MLEYRIACIRDNEDRQSANITLNKLYSAFKERRVYRIQVNSKRIYYVFMVDRDDRKGCLSIFDSYYAVYVTEECCDMILEVYSCRHLETVAVVLQSFYHPIYVCNEEDLFGDKALPGSHKQFYRGEILERSN